MFFFLCDYSSYLPQFFNRTILIILMKKFTTMTLVFLHPPSPKKININWLVF
jgi:hypothetical protein